jgi:hypothetical protein
MENDFRRFSRLNQCRHETCAQAIDKSIVLSSVAMLHIRTIENCMYSFIWCYIFGPQACAFAAFLRRAEDDGVFMRLV